MESILIRLFSQLLLVVHLHNITWEWFLKASNLIYEGMPLTY